MLLLGPLITLKTDILEFDSGVVQDQARQLTQSADVEIDQFDLGHFLSI